MSRVEPSELMEWDLCVIDTSSVWSWSMRWGAVSHQREEVTCDPLLVDLFWWSTGGRKLEKGGGRQWWAFMMMRWVTPPVWEAIESAMSLLLSNHHVELQPWAQLALSGDGLESGWILQTAMISRSEIQMTFHIMLKELIVFDVYKN